MIVLSLVQLKTLNSAIHSFPYGHLEIANKPVRNREDSVNNEDLTGKQSVELHGYLTDIKNYNYIFIIHAQISITNEVPVQRTPIGTCRGLNFYCSYMTYVV